MLIKEKRLVYFSRFNWSTPRIDLVTVSLPPVPLPYHLRPIAHGGAEDLESSSSLDLLYFVYVASIPCHAAQSDDFLFKCGEHAYRASLSGKDSALLD